MAQLQKTKSLRSCDQESFSFATPLENMDREFATKLLLEASFPLLTPEVQDAHSRVHAAHGGPAGHGADALDLLKEYAHHFSRFLYEATDGDSFERVIVYTDAKGWETTEAHVQALSSLLRDFARLRRELQEMDHDHFMAVFEPLRLARSENLQKKAKAFDLTQFFSFPEAEADVDYWLSQPIWTLEEATALCFGKDADIVNTAAIATMSEPSKSFFVQKYKAFWERLKKAQEAGQLQDPTDPKHFLAWIGKHDIALPSSRILLSHSADFNERSGNEAQLDNALTLDETRTQAVHSLYRIVLGIIISKYGSTANPHDLIHQADKYDEILDDIQKSGLSMDRKTLKRYLDRIYDYARRTPLFEAAKGKTASSGKS